MEETKIYFQFLLPVSVKHLSLFFFPFSFTPHLSLLFRFICPWFAYKECFVKYNVSVDKSDKQECISGVHSKTAQLDFYTGT